MQRFEDWPLSFLLLCLTFFSRYVVDDIRLSIDRPPFTPDLKMYLELKELKLNDERLRQNILMMLLQKIQMLTAATWYTQQKKCQDYNGVGFLSSRFQNKIRVLLFLSFLFEIPSYYMIKQVAKRKRERERDEEQRKRNQRKIKGTGVILSAAANKITKKMGNQTGKNSLLFKENSQWQ